MSYVAGFSCKDFSSANKSRSEAEGLLSSAGTSRGGSADTFWGVVGYLDQWQPDLVVLENVDGILDDVPSDGTDAASRGKISNKSQIERELTARDYMVWLKQRSQ